jgi:peptide/nickel transport system permease protein
MATSIPEYEAAMGELLSGRFPPPVRVPPARPGLHRTATAVGAVKLLLGGGVVVTSQVLAHSMSGWLQALLIAVGIGLALKGVADVVTGASGRAIDLAAWCSAGWLVILVLATAFADLLPLGNADDLTTTTGVKGYAKPDVFSAHPLGTNGFGLDLLARAIYGARASLLTVAVAVVVSLVIGGIIGIVAGYFRGWVDATIGVVADSALVIPALVLLIALAAVLGPPRTVSAEVVKTGLALAIVGIPTVIRLARANTMTYAQREFVTASRALGARHFYVLRRDLLPNVVLPLIAYAFIVAAVLVVAEGSLAFLGLGLQQPTPSWGNMIAEGGLRDLQEHPFVALVPGVFMFLTVFSLNVVGERARQHWDARDMQV